MKKLFNSRKGSGFDEMGKLGIAIVTVAIVMVVGFLILATAQDEIVSVDGVDETNTSTWTYSYNSSLETQSALEGFPGWMPIFVIVGLGAVLLGMVRVFRS